MTACAECGALLDSGRIFCAKCGAALKGASLLPVSAEAVQPKQAGGSDVEVAATSIADAMYFAVSPLKLIVMATCTFGLYELYWFYKHWRCVREREPTIVPIARAFFAILFCYPLFDRIQNTGKAYNITKSIAPGALAFGYVVTTILWRLPDLYWLLSYLSVLFLVPVQMAANEINHKTASNHDPNGKFSVGNVVTVLIGGVLLALVVRSSFLPSN